VKAVTNPYPRHNGESWANFDHVYELPNPMKYFDTLTP
jgi:hypothetical protein